MVDGFSKFGKPYFSEGRYVPHVLAAMLWDAPSFGTANEENGCARTSSLSSNVDLPVSVSPVPTTGCSGEAAMN